MRKLIDRVCGLFSSTSSEEKVDSVAIALGRGVSRRKVLLGIAACCAAAAAAELVALC